MIKLIKRLPFYRRYTTNQFSKWWATRKIDWKKEYVDTWNHPHRQLLSWVLNTLPWTSLIEVGCGAGANLINILHYLKKHRNMNLAGIDINPDAIEMAKQTLGSFCKGVHLQVCNIENLIISDDASDVILSDMTLIYVDPRKIDKVIKEFHRVTRSLIVFYEFYSPSWWERFKLRLFSGHNAHNYKKLLTKHGFNDIRVYKVDERVCEDDTQRQFAHIITACVPTRK